MQLDTEIIQICTNKNKQTIKQTKNKTIMKKSIALVAMAFGVTSAFAQDLTSKKGEPILPEAGDYMIGIDANPFLNYLGRFGSAANNAPTFNFMNGNNMIIGKYFKDAKTAYRAGIRIGIDNQATNKQLADVMVATAPVYPAQPTLITDKKSHNQTNVGLIVGIEKRKGKTRLQGFYGADFMIWTSSTKDTYTYGQAIDPTNATYANATTANGFNTSNFGSNLNVGTSAGSSSDRTLSKRTGNGFGFGLRAFIGAEYFILPKISIGGEFGWGVGYMTGGKTTTVSETTGPNASGTNTKNEVSQTVKNGGHFVLDTDLNNTSTGSLLAPSASLRLNLHF